MCSVVSLGPVLGKLLTVAYQKNWYWGSNGIYHNSRTGLCRINRTDSWTVMECVVSGGLVLGQ